MGLAAHNCNDTYPELPPIAGFFPSGNTTNLGSVHFFLLPYVEQDNLYRNAQSQSAVGSNLHTGRRRGPRLRLVNPTLGT